MRKQIVLGMAALLVSASVHAAEAKNVCLIDTDNNPSFGYVVLSEPKVPKLGEAVTIVGMLIQPATPTGVKLSPFTGTAFAQSAGISVTVIGYRPGPFGGPIVLRWLASDQTFQGPGGYTPTPDFLTGVIDQEVLLVSVDCASVPIP